MKAIGPTQVKGLQGITQIAATGRHNLALRSDGKVMAWGLNHDGQLGNGTRDNGWEPAEVSGLDRIVSLMCGEASIREVIAFPKTAQAVDLMSGAPSVVDDKQLRELKIKLS